MKKLFINVFILFILLTLSMAIIILQPLPKDFYSLAIIDKRQILANTKSPKIVLAGGSNITFGIDSAAIHDRFHIPVVNTAVGLSFGLGRILDNISQFLHSGDVLLIIPEYEHFTKIWNGKSEAYGLIFYTQQYRLLWSPYYGLPSNFSSFIRTHLLAIMPRPVRVQNPLAYSRDGFNEYGDYIKHLRMENLPIISDENAGILNHSYLNNFFQFVDDFTKRGITVMLSYPSYEEQSFQNNTALIQELNVLFRARKNLLVISTPESYCFPISYFYDTKYHLNMEGRTIRTNQLIQDLQASGRLPVIE